MAVMGGPLDLLLTRRSVGKLRADPIPRELIEQMLEAATMAPNHHLTQPWRFVVLGGEARRAVGDAHAAAVARVKRDAAPEALQREAARLERAPVVIACVVSGGAPDHVQAREDRDAVAAAVQNLLLAAHGLGLAAIWRTGAMVDEPEVRDALGVAGADAVVAFVYVGRADASPGARERRPLGDVVEWREG
jgi:nitroreductase